MIRSYVRALRFWWATRPRVLFAPAYWIPPEVPPEAEEEARRIAEEYRRRWVERGLPERAADMAVDHAMNWAAGMLMYDLSKLERAGLKLSPEQVAKLYLNYVRSAFDKVTKEWVEEMYGVGG